MPPVSGAVSRPLLKGTYVSLLVYPRTFHHEPTPPVLYPSSDQCGITVVAGEVVLFYKTCTHYDTVHGLYTSSFKNVH